MIRDSLPTSWKVIVEQASFTSPDLSGIDTVDLLYALAGRGDVAAALQEAEHLHYPLLAALCEALGCPMKRMSGDGRGIHVGRLIDALCDMVAALRAEDAAEAQQRTTRKIKTKDYIEREYFMRETERQARKTRWESDIERRKRRDETMARWKGRSDEDAETMRKFWKSDKAASQRGLYWEAAATVCTREQSPIFPKLEGEYLVYQPAHRSTKLNYRPRTREEIDDLGDNARNSRRRPDAETKRRRTELYAVVEKATVGDRHSPLTT